MMLEHRFDRIGDRTYSRAAPTVPTPAAPADVPPESAVGLRTFDEINATLSQITGVPQTNARVRDTYALVKQALPAIEKLGTFGPSQQTALAQLAMQYCNVMVDDNGLRTQFFGSLGLVTLKTFYERVHPPTMGTTLGTGLVIIASMVWFSVQESRPVLHELLIAAFMTITTPVTYMLLVRAAVHRDSMEGNDPLQSGSEPD